MKINKKGLKLFGAIITCTLGTLAGYVTAPLFIEILMIDNPKYPEWYLPVARFFWIAAGGSWGLFFYFNYLKNDEEKGNRHAVR